MCMCIGDDALCIIRVAIRSTGDLGEEEEILVSLTLSDFLFTGPPGSPPRSSVAMSEVGALLAFSE